jgi:hypothetical protein
MSLKKHRFRRRRDEKLRAFYGRRAVNLCSAKSLGGAVSIYELAALTMRSKQISDRPPDIAIVPANA